MPKNIWIIHSHDDLSRLLEMWLVDDGYQIQMYNDREQASQKLPGGPPDLVIIEPSFGDPEADWQFIRKLRSNDGAAQLPVILCTVDTTTLKEQNSYFHALLKNIIVQPFENEALLAAIKDMLK